MSGSRKFSSMAACGWFSKLTFIDLEYNGKCGKYVTIKNNKNGKSVRAMVRDKCKFDHTRLDVL